MIIEDLVPDLELCRLWKEKGGRQDTVFIWVKYTFVSGKVHWSVMEQMEVDEGDAEWIAAPTSGEIMELLKEKCDFEVAHSLEFPENWSVYMYLEPTHLIEDAKLPNALLKMALEVEGK